MLITDIYAANCLQMVPIGLSTVCGFMLSQGFFIGLLLAFLLSFLVLFINYLQNKDERLNPTERIRSTTQLEKEKSLLQQQLIAQERIASLEKTLYERECDLRNKDLIIETVQNISRIKTLQKVENLIDNTGVEATHPDISDIINPLYRTDEAWEQFKMRFELVYPYFFSRFRKAFPELTGQDLQLIAYTRANLKHNDIARLCLVSPESLQKRHFGCEKNWVCATTVSLDHSSTGSNRMNCFCFSPIPAAEEALALTHLKP